MNCSVCGYDDFIEVVLFTSVERTCRICDMRRIVKECLDSPNIWSLPSFEETDLSFGPITIGTFGFTTEEPKIKIERILDYHDHGMQPDMLLLDPVTFAAYKKLSGDK